MKKSFLAISLLISFNAFAGREVAPLNNQCSPIIDSKVYLTSDFHAYPRTVAFECSYMCNSNGKIETVRGLSRITVSNIEQDASGTTCQGVLMKKVPWGWDFDKVEPFYAPATSINEVKRWAFQNVNFNPKVNVAEREKLAALKQDLYKIAGSFIMAGINTPYFKEAGIKISEIADGLPMNTKLLDEAIKVIVVNKGQKIGAPGTPESLIYTMLSSAAAWRIPSHQF
jgi:hypothetical protein